MMLIRSDKQGFTIVEAVISLVIVSVMLVAALSTVSSARVSQATIARTVQAQALAQALLTEVQTQSYAEPTGDKTLGVDVGETTGTRELFDDVDDYDQWSASPLQSRDGTEISGTTDWTRSVVVEWVDPQKPDRVVSAESQVKRITVTIQFRGLFVTSCVALACNQSF